MCHNIRIKCNLWLLQNLRKKMTLVICRASTAFSNNHHSRCFRPLVPVMLFPIWYPSCAGCKTYRLQGKARTIVTTQHVRLSVTDQCDSLRLCPSSPGLLLAGPWLLLITFREMSFSGGSLPVALFPIWNLLQCCVHAVRFIRGSL